MKTYNIELLYQLYKKNDESFNAMEKEIIAENIKGVPRTGEKIKELAEKNNFLGRIRKDKEAEAEAFAKEIEEFDAKLLKITMAGIAKYAQGLQSKKWISEQGFGILFDKYRTLTDRPSNYTKNENDNFNAVSFIDSITDDIQDDTDGVDHDGKENDQSDKTPEGLEILASSGTKLRS